MEEYLDGPEISVETLSFDGRHVVVAVTDKETRRPRLRRDRPFAAQRLLGRDCCARSTRLVTDFLDAVGLRNGPGHTEVKLTSRGPRIVESHNRIGGDRINELAEIAYGVDMERYALGAAVRPGRAADRVARAAGRCGRSGSSRRSPAGSWR